MADDDVLTIKEAAVLLRVHPVTLRRKAVDWGVPHKRLGTEWRFSRKVLIAWLQEREAA
jgi:excisionase family DNA binding protein